MQGHGHRTREWNARARRRVGPTGAYRATIFETLPLRPPMIEPAEIVSLPPQPAAVIPIRIPRPDMPKVMRPAIQELFAVLARQGVAPAGPVFAHHREITREFFDFEVGVPVGAPVAPDHRVQPGTRPGGLMARTVYQGPYEGLGAAWEAFDDWMVAEGYIPSANVVETYLRGPESGPDSSTWRTEFLRPVTRR